MIAPETLQCESPELLSGDALEIAKQFQVELALLLNIEGAMRVALDWQTGDRTIVRKLSTLRFVTETFERHLMRIRVLSEYGGYMHLVTDAKPHLTKEVHGLKQMRDSLQADLERLIVSLENVMSNDLFGFSAICVQYEQYLASLKKHGERELGLFQRSIYQEEGGSG